MFSYLEIVASVVAAALWTGGSSFCALGDIGGTAAVSVGGGGNNTLFPDIDDVSGREGSIVGPWGVSATDEELLGGVAGGAMTPTAGRLGTKEGDTASAAVTGGGRAEVATATGAMSGRSNRCKLIEGMMPGWGPRLNSRPWKTHMTYIIGIAKGWDRKEIPLHI
jgi:hypothetical protein